LSAREWRPIGFWSAAPVIGEVGEVPWDYRPFASYVVLPHPRWRKVGDPVLIDPTVVWGVDFGLNGPMFVRAEV
jgi:hypothetical protein